ncbi:anti-sigma regulatory factor [Candidatus Viridilinea mediisalina]|uniref:Anti-sigma regulatory factor n=1 Tax=Candidatus Viridilinea mediisalina TaxID=2024553 RepID=A0A2A6REB5_9CHLR|nr:anti-sigma regulatory factor [Candidatus Viridilinea mediisalina]PDW01374.1 anti-sigma regulatory factor [Candidatus Viridilinea mediisalina]
MVAPISCPIMREVDVYVAMSRVRELATELGFGLTDRTRIEIVVLELTRNLLVHAGGGSLSFARLDDPNRGVGLMIEATDEGPGIVDIELALQDGYSTAHTLGSGLPGVRRLMDEFRITSTVGVGTHVRAVKWLHVPQRRAIYGR